MAAYGVYGISGFSAKGSPREYIGLAKAEAGTDVTQALAEREEEHRSRGPLCAAFLVGMRRGFTARKLYVTANVADALARELFETIWAAADHGCERGRGARGACFLKTTLPKQERACLAELARRFPARRSAAQAHKALRDALAAGAVGTEQATKIKRHIAGLCWSCGGRHLAAACRRLRSHPQPAKRRKYPSGASKRARRKGGGKSESGSAKRAAGRSGWGKGKWRSKSGAQKRREGKGGGGKGPKKRSGTPL